ncbi:anaerobic ribonucleoside-triphosphate reductase activating protein [Enterococcus faecalis]|jgi:anaerobic ribonucleoside-triphosphate reductase activating protein|uniref:anaerobic ribonucleoside-triphosphate reductase activating protein n=1 Tax=Enterococcus TaxID=1350 RepID=UPI000CF2F87D|nr:anaerobic ribonucleoside-triphosphate reductase activating protein [Enterococcus faecalis]EIT2192658.1 anaerobic ribonucleoside-triphosphate reductase activating protein [Enterococcus faecalis]EIY5962897.1 anaerobic ribonucleoside-triphosphate reductase activating protein [Enterococcus faecalis]EIY5964930.1 anaerobic ribonucleoside-triphosphate reductase activating protein [Enterococcus faecalis]EKZ0175291.1 anaerobic ribonucleoside-triphosphate reductase activating protein [Enterococcus fae
MRNPKPQEWKTEDYSQKKIADYKAFNFVDGEGVRNSLYVSGCLFACEGCFNKAVQNFNYGTPFTESLMNQIIEDLSHDYVQGLTLLGGEPFLNTDVCLSVVKRVRETFGSAKDIWSWSGYTFEELLSETPDKLELLHSIDILVDGRFELAKRNLNLQFRGSSNQRIIDVPKSLAAGKAVIWEKCHDAETSYEQIKKSI